jgi:hypothetical protein
VQRVFGAIAVFAGWLSIGVGAMWGLISSEFIGLTHVEGDVRPSGVYGVSGAVVLWVFTAAAIVTAVPLAAAIVAVDPRRQLRWFAQGLAIVGVALLPDELGRAFGLPLLAGAACLWIGGELIHSEALALAAPPSSAQTPGPAVETTVGATSALTDKASEPAEGRGRSSSRRKSAGPRRICPWCSAVVPANVSSCPSCRATLDEPAADEMSIPGLTEVPLRLQMYAEKARRPRTSLLSMVLGSQPIPIATDAPPPSDAAAMRPPSPELKAEMARLDAEIAAGKAPLGAEDRGEALDEATGESGQPGEDGQPGEGPQPAKSAEPTKTQRSAQRRRSGPRT